MRCECEDLNCHPDADCHKRNTVKEPLYWVRIYGVPTILCADCFAYAVKEYGSQVEEQGTLS